MVPLIAPAVTTSPPPTGGATLSGPARAGVGRTARRALLQRGQPPQDVGVAAQQRHDVDQRDGQEHGDDDRDHHHRPYAPPLPGNWTATGSRQPASWPQTASSIITVPLQLSASIRLGFSQVTTRHTTVVVPLICVLHCP